MAGLPSRPSPLHGVRFKFEVKFQLLRNPDMFLEFLQEVSGGDQVGFDSRFGSPEFPED
jgi:hypothetical protein